MFVAGLTIGLFVGCAGGVIIMAICAAGSYEKGYEDGRNYE